MYTIRESTPRCPRGVEDVSQPVVSVRTAAADLERLPEYSPAPPRLRHLAERISASLQSVVVTLPDGRRFLCGQGRIVAEINVRNSRGIWALSSLNEGNIAEAYLEGDVDMVGNFLQLLELRSFLSDQHYLSWAWRFLEPILFGQIKTNARAISLHYDLDPKFYLSFLDETRCYTQGIFLSDDDPLDEAIRRKFDYCIETCRLGPGTHILEVGPGWGAFSEYAAKRGIRITAVTNSRRSEEFMADLGRRLGCKWQVNVDDFLQYKPTERYDAIVLMGIMEHLPQYDAVVQQFLNALKPGGFVYLDASAARDKYKASSFVYREIYPGNHSFFVLHDFLRAVSRTSLQVRAILDDRHNYFLTFRRWARKFESERKRVVAEFGERNYRRFLLYLWASAHCFLTDRLQCYRLVLELPKQ
jgi:cyclopropane-fatty-acyl-phospholipid synthase